MKELFLIKTSNPDIVHHEGQCGHAFHKKVKGVQKYINKKITDQIDDDKPFKIDALANHHKLSLSSWQKFSLFSIRFWNRFMFKCFPVKNSLTDLF